MAKFENDILENYRAYKDIKNNRAAKFEAARIDAADKKSKFMKDYYSIREKRELNDREHGKLLEEAKNYFFGNALKGIYIGALEAATLTDDGLYLAENMVDSYIKESGGYHTIMNNAKVDTYLLAKIRRVVEDAAEEEVKNLEDQSDDVDNIEDIDMETPPEDEQDTAEVPKDTQLTTANIEDIVSALNQAGLEVVKKDDADNFKEGEPETDETKPDEEVGPAEEPEAPTEEVPEGEPAPEEPANAEEPEAPTEETPENSEEAAPEEDNDLENDLKAADSATTEAPATDDAATEEPTTTTAEPEEKPEEEDTTTTAEPEEEDGDNEDHELEDDLDAAKNAEPEEDEVEDTMDPDSVKVQDEDDEEEEDDGGMELDSDEEGDEDLDDLEDEELGDDSDDEGEDGEDIDIDGDGETDIGDMDEPEATVNVDPNKTMMDELENEKEVRDAVELIRTRVADAEEAFIKRNQEDKKQIDELLSKISKNVATVEKISTDDKETEASKAKLEESTRMYKKHINSISEDKPMSIFDRMTRSISESIIRDPKKVSMFINESTGTPDFSLLTETAKVMYGFLETLNTLQLEKVDGPYITKVINGLK